MNDDPVITGTAWWNARRTWRDVVRCVLGRHRVAMGGVVDRHLVQRCTCGAFGPAPWIYLTDREARGKWERR